MQSQDLNAGGPLPAPLQCFKNKVFLSSATHTPLKQNQQCPKDYGFILFACPVYF